MSSEDPMSMSFCRATRGVLALLCTALVFFCVAMAGSAYADGPMWAISSASSPTNFAAGDETGDDRYVLTAVDTGDGSTDGSRIEVTDALPSGLEASSVSGEDLGNGQTLSCDSSPTVSCSYEGSDVVPGDVLRIEIAVKVKAGVSSSVVSTAAVSGGGAENGATGEDPTTIGSTNAGFGIAGFAASWSGAQAGANVNMTAGFTLNQVVEDDETQPVADAKDVDLDLPPGFVVNPTAVPQCSVSQVQSDACPRESAVGVAFSSLGSGVGGAPTRYSSLVYNAAPAPGELGALVLMLPGDSLRLGLELRTDGDYGLRVSAANLSEVEPLLSMTLTLWGVPGVYNGPGPDHVLAGSAASFGGLGSPMVSFLKAAGVCTGASLASKLSVGSWVEPTVSSEASSASPALTGCNRLPFDPSLSVSSGASEADEPSGYALDLRVPQQEGPAMLASSELKSAAITLPAGAGVSLSAGNGLQTCSEAQAGLGSTAPVTCPDAAKIGTLKVETPMLPNPLQGAVYLAAPEENPFGSPLAIYLLAEDPISGVLVKLAGRLEANSATGQLTIELRELPQLPIGDLELHFFGGERALLSTPPTCGSATTTSMLEPWSGDAPASASSSFEINSGVNGAPCSEPPRFDPTFQVENTTNEAGAYDALILLVTRADQEEELGRVAIQTPQAVGEMFAGVPLCGEPQATEGTCTEASRIGNVQLTAGLGPDVYRISGAAYLTGPYRGAQQGLSLVVPIEVGPFELGDAIVRASEQLEPGSGRMAIETDPLPTVLDGIPLHLTEFALQLDRGEFRLNPEGCEPLTIMGTLTSAQGSPDPIFASAFSPGPQETSTRCPAPQAPVYTPAPGVAPVVAIVSLAGRRLTTSHGKAAIKLTCTGTAKCTGELTLTAKTKDKGRKKRFKTTTIATATFSIPLGKTTRVDLELSSAGRALLSADRGRLGATLTIRKSSPAPSQTHAENVDLVRQK